MRGGVGPRRSVRFAAVVAAALLAGALPGTDSAASGEGGTPSLAYACVFASGEQDVTVDFAQEFPKTGAVGTPIRPGALTLTVTVPRAGATALLPEGTADVSGEADVRTRITQGSSTARADWPDLAARGTPAGGSGDLALEFTGAVPAVEVTAGGRVAFAADALTLTLHPRVLAAGTAAGGTGEGGGPTGGTGEGPGAPATPGTDGGDAAAGGAGTTPDAPPAGSDTAATSGTSGTAAGTADGSGTAAAPRPADVTGTAPSPSATGGLPAAPADLTGSCTPAPGQDLTLATVPVPGPGGTPSPGGSSPSDPGASGTGRPPGGGAGSGHLAGGTVVPLDEPAHSGITTCGKVPIAPLDPDRLPPVSADAIVLPMPGQDPFPPVSQCAFAVGYSNLGKLDGATILNDPHGKPTLAEVNSGQRKVLDFTNEYVEVDSIIALTLPPSHSTFLTYGFMPTSAVVDFVPLGVMTVVQTGDDFFNQPILTTIGGYQEIRVHDVRVNGTPLDVGPDCHTSRPLDVVLKGRKDEQIPGGGDGKPDYDIQDGGALVDENLVIPPFTGCGSNGEDLDNLLTSALSGAGNTLNISQGRICDPANAPELCQPEIQIPPLPVRRH